MRIPPPPRISAATWRERVLLVWLPLLLIVLLVVALFAWADAANAADKQKVKEGATLVLSCPGAGVERGGTAEWFDKRNVSLGIVSGTVVDGTVQFGPAPKRVEYAVAQLDCGPATTTTLPETTTSTSSTTTSTSSTTTTSTTIDRNVYLTGSGFVTDQGLFIYGDPSIPGVQHCPTGYRVSFALSTFTHPSNITVYDYTADFDAIIAIADLDTTGTISWRIVCVPS